jgi:hypothetical protein
MRNARLILNAYFQRNLVWRDAHKRDFIETILKGYPFPQIFLARGPIDLESMEAQQCVVDGQQRLNAIQDFIECRLDVNLKFFSDLTPREKEDFLKYEVAVIDFDLEAGDQRLKEVFQRLNRTYYSLSAIEKLSSEYSSSEFLLVARALCGEIVGSDDEIDELTDADVPSEEDYREDHYTRDPSISTSTWDWLQEHCHGQYKILLQNSSVFTKFEFDRKVPLMFTLNIMCTHILGSYYNRNDKVRKFLEDKLSDFPEKNEAVSSINSSADYISQLNIPDSSAWWSKANFFTLMTEFTNNAKYLELDQNFVIERLLYFEKGMPEEYSLAAREAVSRKSQRELRAKKIRSLLLPEK